GSAHRTEDHESPLDGTLVRAHAAVSMGSGDPVGPPHAAAPDSTRTAEAPTPASSRVMKAPPDRVGYHFDAADAATVACPRKRRPGVLSTRSHSAALGSAARHGQLPPGCQRPAEEDRGDSEDRDANRDDRDLPAGHAAGEAGVSAGWVGQRRV